VGWCSTTPRPRACGTGARPPRPRPSSRKSPATPKRIPIGWSSRPRAEIHHEGTKHTPIMEFDPVSQQVLGLMIEVHRHLGPGLLESAYQACLAYELRSSGLSFAAEVSLPVRYKGLALDCAYRMDFVIEDQLVLELKSVDSLLPIHEA